MGGAFFPDFSIHAARGRTCDDLEYLDVSIHAACGRARDDLKDTFLGFSIHAALGRKRDDLKASVFVVKHKLAAMGGFRAVAYLRA